MAHVRNMTYTSTLGLAANEMQHAILSGIISELEKLGTEEGVQPSPDDEKITETPLPERKFILNSTSMQGLQTGENLGDYEVIVLVQVVEQFMQGVVVIGYAIITSKGLMIDAIESTITDALHQGVKTGVANVDGLDIRSHIITPDGVRVEGGEPQPLPPDHPLRRMMDLFSANVEDD